MNWGSLSAFLDMGGYGGYVWGSFGVTIICMAIEIAMALARQRAATRALPRRGEDPHAISDDPSRGK